MRLPVALGLFLVVAGFMVLMLRPVYRTGERVAYEGVEATGPTEVYRPMPGWLGATMTIAGAALLFGSRGRKR